ncbi:topoisomerase C-terminal repeat-containing protein, partial [Microbacterium gubbeenense]|uniref:topoisomerase C-terminal repeat-containing protein n=1 Tax=Microbacterium gubbeenense TaxID=159896 RepID=UPI003F94D27D
YGPYLKKGADSRSLEAEQQIFDITLEEALEVYTKPKYGARRAASALKEFEKEDPASGKAVRIRDGRFGPYVTDGETNATIPRGTNVDDVDFAAAVQLLADKRAKGPAKKRTTARKTAAKSTTAKKTTAKKAAPKTDEEKAAARSAAAKKAAATRAANAAKKKAQGA